MFAEYIQAALERAQYKIIDDEDPCLCHCSRSALRMGIWQDHRRVPQELMSVIEGWVLFRLRMCRSIPPLGGIDIIVSAEPVSVVE
ncbi:MAG: hypothetical protein CG443_386 [Methanosaeta sp. ASP1-1]|nr:MAG: hypothetical protein CG443_386 [Methanosaeta sp. ASP1-1]